MQSQIRTKFTARLGPRPYRALARVCYITLLILAVLYSLCSPLSAQRVYDFVILHPEAYSGIAYEKNVVDGVTGQDIFFDSLDLKHRLHARYFKLPGSEKTVIISHGIGGNLTTRNDLTAIILSGGASVFIYDYQGYGRSDGRASLNTVCDDGLAAYRYVSKELHIKPATLIACGESMGTGVTCYMAEHASVSGLILQSPFTCLASRCGEIVPLLQGYPNWLYPTSGLDNGTWIRHIKAPILIIHGERDSMIPVRHARELFEAALSRKQLVVVPAAAHTGDPALMESPLYAQAVRKFLASAN